ncbi:ankyrin repeat-containing domain protein [Xylariomycetidae sp. FL2044]|nr:ankyrin repeat-containing domain protein [Xylariomycetidae sp. FL2044]
MDQPNLGQFPTELLLSIYSFVLLPSDKNALVQTCRRLASLLNDSLYSGDVQSWNSSALLWACMTGNVATARRSIDAGGASVNHTFIRCRRTSRVRRCASPHWPRTRGTKLFAKSLPYHPLGVAAMARQPEMVRFLLERGADPNLSDGHAAKHHQRVWYPLHWAVSCGNWGGGAFFERPIYRPVPANVQIVEELLKHGADPNQMTGLDPITGEVVATNSHRSNEAFYPLHMAVCRHVPSEVVRLLLEAGADAMIGGKEFGCRGSYVSWRTPLWVMGPTHCRQSDEDVRKMILLARQNRIPADPRVSWKLDWCYIRDTMEILTPQRMELLKILFPGKPQVAVSGVYAMWDVWTRQKGKVAETTSPEDRDRETGILQGVQGFMDSFLKADPIQYVDLKAPGRAHPVDLAAAFSEMCNDSDKGSQGRFVGLLESQGLVCDGEIKQLSLSEVIERNMDMFHKGLVPNLQISYQLNISRISQSYEARQG